MKKMSQCFKSLSLIVMSGAFLFGCSSEEDVITPAPLPQIQSEFEAHTVWSHGVGGGIGKYYSSLKPVIAGDAVIAASRNGDVYAFDKATGKKLWDIDLSDQTYFEGKRSARLSGGLTAAAGMIFVGSENGQLVSLEASTGKVLWHTDVGGEILASPTVDSGKVLVTTGAGELVALNLENGSKVWNVEAEQPALTLRGTSSPVVAAGGVLYGRADGKVGIVLLQNGQLVNESRVATPHGQTDLDRIVDVDATPVVIDDQLYSIAYNGQFIVRKLISGDEVWKRKYSAFNDMGVGVSDLAVSDAKSHLYLIDRQTGVEKWSNTQLEYRKLTAPLVLGDYVVVGDMDGYLYWISQTTGKIVSMQEIDDSGLYSTPLIDGDMVYVQTRDGELVALKRPS